LSAESPARASGRPDINSRRCFEHGAAGGQFGFGHQHIDPAGRQIDPDAVTGLQQRQTAAIGRLGRGI
jgi:hypothetical protein